MSKITDELRKSMSPCMSEKWLTITTEAFETLADRIDEEHERELTMARGESVNKTLKVMGDCYMALPKDADGVPIHIGDELDGYGYPKGGAYCKAIVNEVTILAGSKDSSYRSWLMWDATEVRHHHEPTVEDVLSDMLEQAVGYSDAHATVALNAIAEYAAKLQLKEDE